ncbi:MAG: hypothetical protein C3F11_09770 [Methylocystaceae bacterium]|nr:MAG: hypothetical protein C3F11_09770 [Methylocystaceae bacterium]
MLSLGPWLQSVLAGGAASSALSVVELTDSHADDCAHDYGGEQDRRRGDAPSPDDCCCPFCDSSTFVAVLPTAHEPAADRTASFAPSRAEAAPFALPAAPIFIQPRAPPSI